MVDATIRVVPRNDLSSLADERFFISLCVAFEQGVQGDAVLLPGSGVFPSSLLPSRSPPQTEYIGDLKSYSL